MNRNNKFPIFFDAPDDAGGGTPSATPADTAALKSMSSGEGGTVDIGESPAETKPDFTKLGNKESISEIVAPEKEAAKAPEKTEAHKEADKPEKSATEAPEREKQAPDAKPEDRKSADKPAESKKDIPDDDKDIEAIQPHANASEATRKSVGEIKKSWIEDRQLARDMSKKNVELEKKLAEVEKSAGKLTPELEKELAEGRRYRAVVLKDADPKFQEEFGTKVKTAEDQLFTILRSPGLGLPEEAEKQMRAELDGYDGQWWQENIFSKISDPLMVRRIEQAILNRDAANAERRAKLDSFSKDYETIIAQTNEDTKKQFDNWVGSVKETVGALEAGQDWANAKEVPADATSAQKQSIEAHNTKVQKLGEQARERILACYHRDPKVTTEVVFRAIEQEYTKAQLDAANKELAELRRRNDELEALAGKAKSLGRQVNSDSAPINKEKPTHRGGIDLGDSAKESKPDFSLLGRGRR